MSKTKNSDQLARANDIIKKLAINCAAIISTENRVLVNNYLRKIREREM